MNKFLQQMRFFIQVKKRIQKQVGASFTDIIQKYCGKYIYDDNKVKADKFCQMLEKLGVIQSSVTQETQHFLEEYGILDDEEEEILKAAEQNSKPDKSSKEDVPQDGEAS